MSIQIKPKTAQYDEPWNRPVAPDQDRLALAKKIMAEPRSSNTMKVPNNGVVLPTSLPSVEPTVMAPKAPPEKSKKKYAMREGSKKTISIRVDPDVLDWLRTQEGWTTKIAQLIWEYMETHKDKS